MSPIRDFRKQLEFYFFVILITITTLYGVWRIYPLITGPHITLTTPQDRENVASTTFQVIGRVSRVKNISLQGRPIPIDKQGNFSEIIVANPPYTLITLVATDFYNKTVIKTIKVFPH